MKKVFLCFAIIFLFVSAAEARAPANAERAKVSVSNEPFPGWKKLDVRSRQVIQTAEDEWVEMIIKTSLLVKRAQNSEFDRVGFKYMSIIRQIVTGKMKASQVKDLVALPFVEYIEAAMPVSKKK